MKKQSALDKKTFQIGGDLPVQRLGFGAMRLTGPGIWGEPKDKEEAIRVLRRAVELGINFVDTADSYGPEVSERIIAEALHPYPTGLVIATKAGLVRPGPDQWTPNGQPAYLRKRCEGSSVQNLYSVANRNAEDVVEYCERESLGFIPWFPLAAGELTAPGGILDRTAKEFSLTMSQLALVWLLWRSPVMLPIPGTSKVSHLEENIAAASITLDENRLQALNNLVPAGG